MFKVHFRHVCEDYISIKQNNEYYVGPGTWGCARNVLPCIPLQLIGAGYLLLVLWPHCWACIRDQQSPLSSASVQLVQLEAVNKLKSSSILYVFKSKHMQLHTKLGFVSKLG